ncbi:MAG: FtsX-like permease family protein [Gammaproteobacteria bacterium]
MRRLLARASLGFLHRHPWQIFLAVIGVALGVGVVVAIDLASTSATAAFTYSTEAVVGKATHRVVGGAQGLDEKLYTRLRLHQGFSGLRPVVEGYVTLDTRAGHHLRLLGIDPLAELSFDNDRYFGAALEERGMFFELMAQPGRMLLSNSTTHRLDLAVGQELTVIVGTKRSTLRLVGFATARDGIQREGLDDLIIVDIATAQEVLGMEGRLSHIDFTEQKSFRKRLPDLDRALPKNARLIEIGAQQRSVRNMARAFYSNLSALSLLALLVGSFLIFNTISFMVVQRRELIGSLRALGVTRAQVFSLILLEAVVLGTCGTLIGALLGTALAKVLLGLIARTVNDFYFPVSVTQLAFSAWVYAKGALVGMCATSLAAALPAWEAARVAPRIALGRSHLERRSVTLVRRAAPIGVLGIIVGLGIIHFSDRSLVLGISGLFALLLGYTLITPLLMVALMHLMQPVLGRWWGILGRLPARLVTAALSRTAVSVGALMLAVATTIGIALMIASLRNAVGHWLQDILRADLYVSIPSEAAPGSSAYIDHSFLARIRAMPGVQAVSSVRRVQLQTYREPVEIVVYEMAPASYAAFRFTDADPIPPWKAFHQGAVIVSEPFAYHGRLKPGSQLKLPTDAGERTFLVAGVFTSYGSDRGVIAMERNQFDRYWRAPGYSALGIYAEPEADLANLRERIRLLAVGYPLEINNSRAIRESSMQIFDQTFLITEVLRLIAGIIAFVGVLSALLALQLERSKHLAILRAIGLTPRQLWSLVLTETALMGSVAGLLALPAGSLMGLVLVQVINRRAFGWSMDFHVPPEALAQGLALAILASLLAGIYPAYKMASTTPASAMRGE